MTDDTPWRPEMGNWFKATVVGCTMLGTVLGCGGGGGGGGGGGPSLTIAKSGAPNGDAQTATVATAVADSLRVLVQEDGLPKAGATVSWNTTSGAVSPASVQTDGAGLAATRWTLGQAAGAQTARATLGGASGSPVTFSATGTAGAAAALTLNAGSGQVALINQAFTTPLTVKVVDQFGNGISGVTVNWAVQSGSLGINGGATSATNATGIASNTISAGATAGAGLIRATTASVAGANVDFSLTAYRAIVAATITTTFRSRRNNTVNPAIDTVQAGQAVLWTVDGGHTVESLGVPSFTSSGTLTTGQTYTVTFNNAGTYQYDCAIHGALMTGTVVVLP